MAINESNADAYEAPASPRKIDDQMGLLEINTIL